MSSTTKRFQNEKRPQGYRGSGFQEEQELLSEMKKRRLEDGTLQIFKSEFVVEGLLRKILNVKQGDGKNSEQTEDEEE